MSLSSDLSVNRNTLSRKEIKIGYYLIICAILLVLFAVFYPGVYAHFVASEDEPGFYAESLKLDPYLWLSSGYTNDFVPYPEWFTPFTSFIRPATNAFAWVLHQAFGNNFVYYIYWYYVFIFLSSIYLFRCLNDIGVKGPILLFAAVIWPLSPPVISMGLWNFPFIFDIATALLVIISFRAVVYERYGLAFLTLALALATKETAAFAPVAAAATVLITRRFSVASWGLSAFMLLPVILWAGVRHFYLGEVFGGTYARIGFMSVLHAVGVWPVGISPAFATLGKLSFTINWFSNAKNIIDTVAVVVTTLAWVTIVSIYIKYAAPLVNRFVSKEQNLASQEDKWFLATLIWFAGALAYLLVNNLYSRYGGCYILFLLLTLITVAYRDRQTIVGRLSLSSLFALTILYIPAAAYTLNALRDQATVAQKLHASLDEALTGLVGPGRKVYIVNAPRGFSTPQYIALLLDSPHELIFLNQFSDCTKAVDFSGVPVNTDRGLRITLPECARLTFDGATNSEFKSGTVDVVQRPGVGTYSFGSQKAVPLSIVPGYTLNGHEFYFQGAPAFADIIYYDWSKERFEHLNLAR